MAALRQMVPQYRRALGCRITSPLVIVIVVVVMLTVRVPIIGVVAHPVVVRPVTMAIIVLVPMPSNCDSNGHRSNAPRGLDDATRKADSKAHKQCSRD
ncbi:hypothetical protein R70006_08301 [Paraburkholderia domus]|nr:hypothetical protein R75483_07885 [Paraburkholderia domus]CAE6865217.1 hypothetical protein R70006_08301 [Paraburkholderia domus]